MISRARLLLACWILRFGLVFGVIRRRSVDMKARFVSIVIVFVLHCGQAHADCDHNPSKLTLTQVNTILTGNFACGKSTAIDPPGWNEKHTGSSASGALIEQHEGGTTVETVGTWATSTSGGNGRVTYFYTGGGSTDVYEIAVLGRISCSNNAA